jgi:CubicO group peptidase (beta-lactamase class C family)
VKRNQKALAIALSSLALTIVLAVPSAAAAAGSSGPDLTNALNQLDSYVKSALGKTQVPGAAVAVVYKDQVVFLKGYGVRRVGTNLPIDPDTVFEIASFSKPISSTVVAAAVGRGEVSWDSRIKDLDPEFALSNPAITDQVTVRDFLSHRSSLPEGSGDTLEALGATRTEILHQLRYVPLKGVFRQTYSYSNFGITEGALAATRALGTWEEVTEELLYKKLGMTSTSSRFSDYENRPDRASLHYLEADGQFKNRYVREADAESPAGGVNSSARDLAQWLRLQLAGGSYNGQQIVDQAALEETHKPQICKAGEKQTPSGPVCPGNAYYGLGWDIDYLPSGEVRISHSGAFLLGSATTVYMLPSEQIGILVLTNTTPVGLPEAIALTFLDYFKYGEAKSDYLKAAQQAFAELVAGVLASSTNYSTEKPPANPSPAGNLSSYVGTYRNQYYGDLEIEQRDQRLILRLPPLGTYYELSHWDGNTFTYYIGTEVSGAARRGVQFLSDKQVKIENLVFENNGIFTRVQH